jgi:NDP-sugar pyrophosphorylase family protein
MQVVILAAGEGTRLRPLTYETPKPLLPVAGKPILQHTLEQLKGIASEVILVIGYLGDKILKHFGERFEDIRLHYVWQREQLGTAHALAQVEHLIKGRFILIMGDNIYHHDDIVRCTEYPLCVLATEVDDASQLGVFLTEGNVIKAIIEKPKQFVSNLANTALYVFDQRIFEEIRNLGKTERNEYELPDALRALCKRDTVYLVKVTKYWIPIAYEADLERADAMLREMNRMTVM